MKASLLWNLISKNEMPPQESETPLTASEKKIIKAWIQTGKFPSQIEIDKSRLQRLQQEARKHWAFRSVTKPLVPSVKNRHWVKNPIDSFLLAKMESNKLAPVQDATPEQLLRRVYIDLTGLPPAVEDVLQFKKDYRKNKKALEIVVDKLLASPGFGERWGRHWLDIARYADTLGGGANYTINNAWRYREYVIQSFNKDKPYNQFIKEQIAGDLLPYKNVEQREEQLTATGFLALGTKDLTDQDKVKLVADVVDEQLDTLGKAFMGLSLGCARCHGHKFDPIPMKDYYALAGIFHSTRTLKKQNDKKKFSNKPTWVRVPHPSLSQKEIKKLEENAKKKNAALRKKDKELKDRIDLLTKNEKELRDKIAQGSLDSQKGALMLKKVSQQLKMTRKEQMLHGKKKGGFTYIHMLFGAMYPQIIAVKESETPANSRINIAGDPKTLGVEVPRGMIRAFGVSSQKIPKNASGRLQFAQWLTATSHPLTSRVMVNRIWRYLMGRGIVQSVDNFGTRGDKPTHPKLLDYLAIQFVKEGWSSKKMIRKIVLSHAYQISSVPNKLNEKIDSKNINYWRFNARRLDAEGMRDSLLVSSGQLNRKRGGPTLEYIGIFGLGGKYPIKRKNLWHRRSVYLPVRRGVLSARTAMFPTFDFPSANIVCGERNRSIVPTQSLFLMNNQLVLDSTAAFAKQLIHLQKDERERINRAYLTVFGREASKKEIERAIAFIQSVRQPEASHKPTEEEGLARFIQVLFSGSEFLILN